MKYLTFALSYAQPRSHGFFYLVKSLLSFRTTLKAKASSGKVTKFLLGGENIFLVNIVSETQQKGTIFSLFLLLKKKVRKNNGENFKLDSDSIGKETYFV